MNCSTPGIPVHDQLLVFTQTHVHQVSDVIQPSHPLSSPSPPSPNPSQHQGLFQWVNSSHEVAKVSDAMILVFWMLSFKPIFSNSSFTFIKRLFSSSSLYAIRVMPSAYLRLLIFLQEILIPACASSSPAFLMMYSAYKLNAGWQDKLKAGWQYTTLMYSFSYLEPVCCSMSSYCCFLTCI